jgi:hypothetical protein
LVFYKKMGSAPCVAKASPSIQDTIKSSYDRCMAIMDEATSSRRNTQSDSPWESRFASDDTIKEFHDAVTNLLTTSIDQKYIGNWL